VLPAAVPDSCQRGVFFSARLEAFRDLVRGAFFTALAGGEFSPPAFFFAVEGSMQNRKTPLLDLPEGAFSTSVVREIAYLISR
jgi:hypothetical protein